MRKVTRHTKSLVAIALVIAGLAMGTFGFISMGLFLILTAGVLVAVPDARKLGSSPILYVALAALFALDAGRSTNPYQWVIVVIFLGIAGYLFFRKPAEN